MQPSFLTRAACLAVLALVSPSRADVRIESKTVSQGLMGFGDGTSHSVTMVAPDRSRSEDEFTYTGRFKTFIGGKPTKSATIVRLDRELMWMVDFEKKEYSEVTFAQMKEMMEKAAAEMKAKSAELKQAQTEAAGRAQDTNMKFTTDVKKTGEKQEINGFPCEHVIVTSIGKTDPPESLNVEIHIVLDQWLTKKVPGEKEVADYYVAFAKKAGLDAGLSKLAPMARQMYGRGINEIEGKMKDVQGTAIRSTFSIEGPPPSAEQQQAKKQAAEDMKKASAERDKQEKVQDVTDAASIGTSAAQGQDIKGGVGGFLGRKLGNMVAKKAEKSAIKSAESEPGSIFKTVTDVVSITTSPADPASFEIPAGFKLEKPEPEKKKK